MRCAPTSTIGWASRAIAARLRSAPASGASASSCCPGARDEEIVSHPEGNTPLVAREAVASFAGVRDLWLKHEGHNPSASFKDRGMTAALTQAKRIGALAVACASTGNTSASLAAYAAQAGIPAFVLVPEGRVSTGKLAQTLAYGAHMIRLRGDFDDCLELAREASERLGVYLVNSLNPFRVEGQKTIVLELLQQLGWEAPDWIALPAGNLGNTAAFGKALREAHALGLIDRVPRLLAVQAAGAAPFAAGFSDDFATRRRVRAETAATAIRIGDPASWDRAVDAIRFSNGHVAAVSDAEIFAAKRVIDSCGVGCEPASAASVAGVRVLAERGIIARRRSRRRGAHGSSAEGSRRRPRGPRCRRPRLRRLAHARRGAWPPRTRARGLLRRRAARRRANFRRYRSEAVTILHCASRRATHRG